MTALCLIYLLEMSAFDPFRTGMMRWGCLAFLAVREICGSLCFSPRTELLPPFSAVLFFPMFVQCLQDPVSAPVSLVRNLSFLVYSVVLRSLMRGNTCGELSERMQQFAKVFILSVLTGNLICLTRYSGNHDWTGMMENRNMTVSVLMSAACISGMFPGRKYRIAGAAAVLLAWHTGSRMAAVMTAVLYGRDFLKHLMISAVLIPAAAACRKYAVPLRRLSASGNGLTRDTWKIGLDLFLRNPLTGTGAGSAWYYTFVQNSGGWGRGMHNSWLVILSENGIIGSLFYLLFSAVYACRIHSSAGTGSPLIRRTCITLMIMLGINGISESFLFSAGNVMALPFWMCFWYLEKMSEVKA